jgi:ATP phosphoribosyltransferase regulatory subunit
LAPTDNDPALAGAIEKLRASGEVVIVELPGHENAREELGCDRVLTKKDGKWLVM